MSATICWEPVNPNPKYLRVMGPSWFIGVLQKLDLDLPCEVGEQDLPGLRGAAAAVDERDGTNPFADLIDIIEKYGVVRLWVEY